MDPKQDQYEYNLNCQQYIVKGPAHGPRGTGKVTGGLSKWIEPLKLQGKEQGIGCLALVGSHVTAEGTTVGTATGKQSTQKILKICKADNPWNYILFFLI